MSICLCNLSADAALELAAHKKLDLVPASPDPSSFTANTHLLANTLSGIADRLPKPIELLVGNANLRRDDLGLSYHVWKGDLPKNSILSLEEDVYVTTPEFTLLQQASQLHQANLCCLLGRYLGTWSPISDEHGKQGKRAPLTSFESVERFLQGIRGVSGKSNLRLAMAYTCEGAASAPETALQLALCLPPELHGLTLTQPIMNYEVALSSEAQKLYPHSSIRIDLCWPHKKFGIEYQGEDHGSQLGADYARWLAARKEGYELWFVSAEQLNSVEQMLFLGREVAKRLAANVDEGLWPTEYELEELLAILTNKRHLGPVRFRELLKRRKAARAWRRTATRP